MASPTVSVVMSVFNGQAFLPEALESILGQTFRDFEFVVIDDGSTDRTGEILASYVGRDERIHVIRHENKGRAASLNVGIGLARGKYIARIDADDVALPNRLREQVDFMERNPEVGLLGGIIELINKNGVLITTICPPLDDSGIRSLMLRYNPYHPAVLMQRETVLAAGGYRKALLDADDYDMYLRIGERSRLANLGKSVLQYRIHSDQVSFRKMREQAMCVLAARAAASLRRRGGPDPLSEVEKITPELMDALGVTPAEFEQALLDGYRYWMEILGRSDPGAAVRLIDEFSRLAGSGAIEPATLANEWLTVAQIHYRQGRTSKALGSALRAILARPSIAGRPAKRALSRLRTGLRRRRPGNE